MTVEAMTTPQEPAVSTTTVDPNAGQPETTPQVEAAPEAVDPLAEAAAWIKENDIELNAPAGEQSTETPSAPSAAAALAQGEQQPPATAEGAEQPGGAPRETIEVERPDLAGLPAWKRGMVLRKEAAAGRQDATTLQQEQLLQRLAAIEQRVSQPQAPPQPAVHPDVLAAMKSGSPLAVLQAMSKYGGKPIDQSVQQLYTELTQPEQAKAPEKPANGAQDKLLSQVLQKLEALEKAPEQWRAEQEQQQRIASMQWDYNQLAAIPLTPGYAKRWPSLASLPPALFKPLVSEAVQTYHQEGVPVDHIALAEELEETAKNWYGHMSSRLSGPGQPPASQQGNPPGQPGNQQKAPQVQGNPLGTSAPGKPESIATAITNADGATANRDMTAAEEEAFLRRAFDKTFSLDPDSWG